MRDLGGLPTHDGGSTAWGAIVRGDAPDRLTAEGWSALAAAGIRTVIDLRHECGDAGRPVVPVPLDDPGDTEFWRRWGGGLDCTPLYYGAFLETFPSRVGRVIAAVADAPAGGVLVHCEGGRDRTGLVVMVLLALVGVRAEAIAADYALSTERLEPVWAELGVGDQTGKIAAFLAPRCNGAGGRRCRA
nr:tyrosine-protein phosphatase [Amycolatopsis acidicola]